MGRSQVLYNRTKGRYKNRGQPQTQQEGNATTGPTASARDPPVNPGRGRGRGGPGRGGSGGRYGRTSADASNAAVRTKRRPKYDESILLLDTDQPRYYSSTPKARTDGLVISVLDSASGGSNIDLSSMATTLNSLSLAKRLRLPSHLADCLLEPPPPDITGITIDKMDMEIEKILTKKSDDYNSPKGQDDEDSSIESLTARLTRSEMIASPGSVNSSHTRQKIIKLPTTVDVPKEAPTSIAADDHSVRILENGDVEVRQKGSSTHHGTTTTGNIDRLLQEDTSSPQEVPKLPTPTAADADVNADETNDQDIINEDIDALLLGDQASIAPSLPPNIAMSPTNHSAAPGTFNCALDSLRQQVFLTKPSASEVISDEQQQQEQQQQLNQVHIPAFAPQQALFDSFDDTLVGGDNDNDDKYLVFGTVPESTFSDTERDRQEMYSSSSDTPIEEGSIDATLEKIQKVKEKMSKIDQAYNGLNDVASSSDSYDDDDDDAEYDDSDHRGRGYSKQQGGQEQEYLEDWLDDTMKYSKIVEEGAGYDNAEAMGRARAQGEDDSYRSSSMSTVTRSTVMTKSTRTVGGDSRCWSVDSRGKLFESDEEEKRAEDLDAWLDSVIK